MEDPFVLDTVASLREVGAVLSQVQNGREVALSYYRQRLSKAERNYCVIRRELLAIACESSIAIMADSFPIQWDH